MKHVEMLKKVMLALFVISCLFFASFLKDYRMYVKATSSNSIMWTVDDDKPANFTKIQDAINSPLVSAGDVIYVHNGTYQENLIVNKTLSLIGENKENTVINGSGVNNVVSIRANNVSLEHFTITRSGGYSYSGVECVNTYSDIVVSNNKIVGNYMGISAHFSNNNVFANNIISDNYEGISLFSSGNSIISGNVIFLNNYDGIYLGYSSDNVITNNMIRNNHRGISIYFSSNNVISGNTLLNNYEGIGISELGGDNIIYHNNFNNTYQGGIESKNIWDYNNEGNFWIYYEGKDLNHDGIGDNPYVRGENNVDNYPLMGVFSSFEVIWETRPYQVRIISNSTISNLRFEIGQETGNQIIRFNASGKEGTNGFCRVTIPIAFMESPYIVLDDNGNITPTAINISDTTKACIYFTYLNKNSTISVISSEKLILYYELLDRYLELQQLLNRLNETYNSFSINYGLFLGNYSALLDAFIALNASYQRHLSDYADQLQNVRSLMYIFAATTAIFMVTTVYLSRQAHTRMKAKVKKTEEER